MGDLFLYSIYLILSLLSFFTGYVFSKKKSAISRLVTFRRKRHRSLKKIQIGKQKAYFRKSVKQNQPLLMRLHNWSSDYTNIDRLSNYAAELDWNYIHPNFQGRNNHPDACGSQKVINDIDDAIDYAVKHGNVDKSKIYVVGGSGGGYATLLTFMKSKHVINTFMAWVPISDLEAWYYESVGRGEIYADDILKCTDSTEKLNVQEARRRSPLHMDTPMEKLVNSKIKLFTGVHDGYSGAVPITQAINFYNKLAEDSSEPIINQEDTLYLLEKRKGKELLGKIQDRGIHLYRNFGNVEITVFEGGHDMLDKHTIDVLVNNK